MLILSGTTKTARYPFTAAAMASPTPVLPAVGSTIVPPGPRRPSRSAVSIMRIAIRSFTEPPGLKYSTLANSRAPDGGAIFLSRISGVPPISSSTLASARRRSGNGFSAVAAAAGASGCSDSRAAPVLAFIGFIKLHLYSLTTSDMKSSWGALSPTSWVPGFADERKPPTSIVGGGL